GCCVLFFIVISYIGLSFIMYCRSNPIAEQNKVVAISDVSKIPNDTSIIIAPKISTVTCKFISKHKDIGGQLFLLFCTIASAKRSNCKLVLPTCLLSMPIARLFNLSHFAFYDMTIDHTYYEYDNYEDITIPATGKIYNIRGSRQCFGYFSEYTDY